MLVKSLFLIVLSHLVSAQSGLDYDQYVQKLFKRMQDQMGINMENFKNPSFLKVHWQNTKLKRILIVEIDVKKDEFNVDISEGTILISGKRIVSLKRKNESGEVIFESTQSQQFHKQIAVPRDVDESSAKLKIKSDKLIIEFNKSFGKKI